MQISMHLIKNISGLWGSLAEIQKTTLTLLLFGTGKVDIMVEYGSKKYRPIYDKGLIFFEPFSTIISTFPVPDYNKVNVVL